MPLKLDNFLQPQLSQFTLSSSPTSTAQSTHLSSQSEPKPMAQFTLSSPTSTAQSLHLSSEPMAQFTSSSPTSTAKCTLSYESMATDLPAAAHAQHYSHDPAEWEITENLRDYFVKNLFLPFQDVTSSYIFQHPKITNILICAYNCAHLFVPNFIL